MRSRAFTLIELLVVITIIAILAGLLFPVFQQAKFAGKRTVDISNLHQVGIAMQTYMGDYDDYYPYAIDATDKYAPQIWNAEPTFQAQLPNLPLMSDALQPYAKSKEIFDCPLDDGMQVLDSHPDIIFPVSPSMFKKYGLSYLYRTEIAIKGLTSTSMAQPSNVNVMFTAAGHWLGSGRALSPSDNFITEAALTTKYRYDVLFADSHVKNLTWDQYESAWGIQL